MKKYRINTTYYYSNNMRNRDKKKDCLGYISITNSQPKWYNGEILKIASPSMDLIRLLSKNKISINEFKKQYFEKLNKIDIFDILHNIDGKTIVGYEKPGKHCKCHRFLLIEYLKNLGYNVESREL